MEHDQEYDNPNAFFQAEASFTILDWLILDEIKSNSDLKIENVDQNQKL